MIVTIGKKIIDSEKLFEKPYIIAEAGVNHEGNLEKAKLMIRQAKDGGADAIKFQAYKAELLAARNSPAYWDMAMESSKSQYELFRKYDNFWKKEYEELWHYSQEIGIEFLATPFDFESADFLDPLLVAYKIASADINNLPFLRHIARKGKPVILSTGASTISEIWRAIETLKAESNEEVILLHCVLNYPTLYTNANLAMISDMRKKFSGYIIGYSDHTLAHKVVEVFSSAWLLGAQIIEKHFTYDKSLKGNDHYHSMDMDDLRKVVTSLSQIYEMLGNTEKRYLESEEVARRNARRSLVALRNIKKGELITSNDIAIKRPGTGVPPELFYQVIGSVAARDIDKDEVLKFGDFSEI